MPKPNFAASRLVNPPGASPVLTEGQVWKGLGIKARNPQTFVPVITSCEIVHDDGNKLVRSVRFGEAEPVTESIDLYESTIAYFEIASKDIHITNILSYDADGELVLTFSFANGIPGYDPGEALPEPKELNKRIGGGVEHTIDRIRELVKEGTI
ncbi:hypothetical protein Hypma_013252 [Hypsizygus marmoreus]|uniref:DUF1857 domain-containing protein n=1 Tax=Hypsizygus marmoreus TaxID=39966 RepID=A0A369JE31_HYPMA|nr:hypothetical protein Hypma_013252 [Hypsizygus marmoreus]